MSKADEIKIIDLLNKIANEEDLPKKIKHENEIYIYEEHCKDYSCISNKEYGYLLKDDFGYNYCYKRLNDEIEVIEDQTIDIDSIEELHKWVTERDGEVTQTEGKILEIGYKTNELIQAVKHLNKEIQSIKEK